MACNDKIKNKCIPVFDFITEFNSKEKLVKYFNIALSNLNKHFSKENIEDSLRKFKIAPIIVTFYSPFSIESLMFSFNSMEVDLYLEWSFDVLKNDSRSKNIVNTFVYISAKSFLNYFIHNLRKFKFLNMNIKKLAVYCISLMQNSILFESVEMYLSHIQIIYLSRKKNNSTTNSLNFIKKEIQKQKLDRINIVDLLLNDAQYEKKTKYSLEYFLFENNLYFSNSPFEKYFERKTYFKKHFLNLNIQNLEPKNEFYSPEIFGLIRENLSCLPFWSGLLLHHFQTKFPSIYSNNPFTYLTNEPVRTYLSILKNQLKNKTNEASSIVSSLYPEIKRIYNKHYLANQDNNVFTLEKNKKKFEEEEEEEEKWFSGSHEYRKNKEFSYYGTNILKNDFTIDLKYKCNDENYFNKVATQHFRHSFVFEIKEKSFREKLREKYKSWTNKNLNCNYQMNLLKFKINSLDLKKLSFLFQNLSNKNLISDIKKVFDNDRVFFDKWVDFVRGLKQFVFNEQHFSNCYTVFLDSFITSPFIPVNVSANGNCLYNSFSSLYFNSSHYYFIFKILSIYLIFKYSEFLKNDFTETDIDSVIVKSLRMEEWGTDFNVFSLAILLNRPVNVYQIDEDKKVNLITKFLNNQQLESIPVLIGYCFIENNRNLGHFFPIFIKDTLININLISDFESTIKRTNYPDNYFCINLNNINN